MAPTEPAADTAVRRVFVDRTVGEAEQVEVFLDAQRALLRATLDGMTEEEGRRHLVPSQTTLLGLLKHVTFMQVVWYQEAITGTPRTELGQPEAVDDSFVVSETDSIASVRAAFDESCRVARRVSDAEGADDVVAGHQLGEMTLRWIHLQVLRELAHHNGHADILREQLLAARDDTGAQTDNT